ncbi:retrotransposon protein [Cucumis melo var. makuwa]|uniref:Retrotransposon protein n=2 Tax=Cucumis melo TaxID=3656 RepID=A0A5A7UA62_CUCMM|nr:retrotransposon protein [Cucumis melo var. makuwa]TYK03592.1 retrotransposon protein [Cucumis melo var. makuwa]
MLEGPVKGLLNKLFPHYDALSYVFGKDRATGDRAETFEDIASNVPTDNDRVPAEDDMDTKFLAICSPRMNMSPEDMMGAISQEDAMAAQVIEHMEAILSLIIMAGSKCIMIVNQKVSLMISFTQMFDPVKVAYCRILLSDDS